MKTIVKTKLIAILAIMTAIMSFMVVFCGFNTAKADTAAEVSISEATVNIVKGAEIKTKGNMGIRFTASVSADHFSGLKAKYGEVEYGMIIAPTDFIKSEDTFKIGGWEYAAGDNVTEYVKGQNESGKLYQRAAVNPVLTGGEYVFKGAFVNIATENYDRDFSVRAYVKVNGEDPVYSDVATRSVFTVATGALASGALADDADGLTYVKGVTNTVNANYSDYSVSYYNATAGKEKTDAIVVGDSIAFEATLSDGEEEIMATPEIVTLPSFVTAELDEFGFRTGKYKVTQDCDFGVKTAITGSQNNKDISCWVDIKNTTSTIENITLEDNASFFSGSGSIAKIEEPITDDDVSAAALASSTAETVYVTDSPNGANSKIYFGGSSANKLTNKYFSFKFYNYGYQNSKYSWTFAGHMMYKGSFERLNASDYYGRYVVKVYDQYGNDIGVTGVDEYNKYKDTWCTFEIACIKYPGAWFNIHTDFGGTAGMYTKMYLSDFKIANHSLAETYSDLEVRVEDKNGEAVKPGDELAFSAYAIPFGGSEKVKVNAIITATEGAMEGNIYQGTGNFTVTAKAFGMTATNDVTAVEGVMPKFEQKGLSFLSTNNAEYVSVALATENIPAGAPSGKEVFVATFTGNAPTGTPEDNAAGRAVLFNKKELYQGCCLTFKYYLDGHRIMLNGNIYTNSTSNKLSTEGIQTNAGLYEGYVTIEHLASDGTRITMDNVTNYDDQWVTVKMQFDNVAGALGNAAVAIFNNMHHYRSTLYLTDITVDNYALLA